MESIRYEVGIRFTKWPSTGRVKEWWTRLWKLKVPSKIKHFIWRAFHVCVPTLVNLQHHHVDTAIICPICGKHPKSTDHVLFRCSRAKQVWRLLDLKITIQDYHFLSVQDRLLELCELDQGNSLEWICVGAWAIWNDRNSVLTWKANSRSSCEMQMDCRILTGVPSSDSEWVNVETDDSQYTTFQYWSYI